MSNRPRLEIHISNDDVCGHVKDVKEMGFTQVMGDSSVATEAEKQGLHFVLANFWTTEAMDWERDIRPQIEPFVRSENLVSINMMDEPIYWDFDDETPTELKKPIRTPECYREIHDRVRKEYKEYDLDLSLAFFGPDTGRWKDEQRRQYFLEYFPAIEQLRMNIYPALKNCPLGVIITWLDYLKKEMQQQDHPMPVTVTLQTWCLPEHPRYPTIDELRVMAYLGFLGGAHTVSFYQYEPEVWERLPGFSERFKKLVAELNERAEVLEGAHVDGGFVEPHKELYRARVTPAHGRTEIDVVINTTDKKIEELAPYEVSWESRRLDV